MTHQQLSRRVFRLEQERRQIKPQRHPMEIESNRLKPRQREVFESSERFRILVAGRRFGKTYLALVELLKAASQPESLVWYVGPTYKQAKRIAWKPLKKFRR